MSTELVTSVEITPSVTDISIDNQFDTVVTNMHEIDPTTSTSIVEGHKKEYSIVGDALYASVSTSEAPQWLTDIIDSLVSTSVASGMVNYDLLVQDVYNAIDALDLAGNTYVQQIQFDSLVDSRIAAQLEVLNATYEDTYATKVELTTAEAGLNDAIISASTALESAYTDAINAKALEITTAYSTANAVTASNIDVLTTAFADQNEILVNQAEAISTLENSLTGYVDSSMASLEAKFEYGSNITLNGITQSAGFGLVNNLSTVNGAPPLGSSEFWIDAQKLKFTNSNNTGVTAPFTIDASGTTPQITFNGVVSFTNVSGTPTHTSGTTDPTGTAINGSTYTNTTNSSLWVYSNGWVQSGDPNALTAEDVSATGTTVIDGGRIDTGTITASKMAAGSITAENAAIADLAVKRINLEVGAITDKYFQQTSVSVNFPTTEVLYGSYQTALAAYANGEFPTKFKSLGSQTINISSDSSLIPESMVLELGLGRSISYSITSTTSTWHTVSLWSFFVIKNNGVVVATTGTPYAEIFISNGYMLWPANSFSTAKATLTKDIDYSANSTVTIEYYAYKYRTYSGYNPGLYVGNLSMEVEEFYK